MTSSDNQDLPRADSSPRTVKMPAGRGAARPPQLGRIDRYILLRQLGTGGFGAVYRARDEEAGIDVALKVLPAAVSSNPDELAAIRDNFRLVARLRHPNIANVLHLHTVEYVDPVADTATGIVPGDRLLVMDFVPGMTLLAWRRKFPEARATLEQTLAVASQIAEALDYAHSKKIIHRDIKPANVIVTPAGEVRILDFGLAAQIKASLTQVSQFKEEISGTPAYMPPEQWAGRPQGAASDQYGFGVLVYEMLSGTVPFASAFESNDHQVMYAAVKNELPEPLRCLHKAGNQAVMRALAKSPSDRFASCAEFVGALGGKKWRRANGDRPARPKTDFDSAHHPQRGHLPTPFSRSARLLLLLALVMAATILATRQFSPAARDPEPPPPADGHASVVGELLVLARTAVGTGNHGGARPLLGRVLELDPGNKEAQSLLAGLGQLPGLADVVPVRSEAKTKWEQASQFDRGQGFGETIDRGDAVMAAAEILFKAGEYRQALDRYRQILDDYASLNALEYDRMQARTEKANALAARKRAMATDDSIVKGSFFSGAEELLKSADTVYAAGDFTEAVRLSITASAEFAKAQAQAMGTLAAQMAEKSYRQRLAECDPVLLEMWGGDAWEQVKLVAESAERLGRAAAWEDAVREWSKARTLLDAVVITSLEAEERAGNGGGTDVIDASLTAALAAKALSRAETAKAVGDWESARYFASEALSFAPDSTAAKTLLARAREALGLTLEIVAVSGGKEIAGARILVDGEDTGMRTPGSVKLENGRDYRIRVEYTPADGAARYLPYETIFRGSGQKASRLHATLAAAPLPMDLAPARDPAMVSLAGLAVGSREAMEKQRDYAAKSRFPVEAASVKSGIRFRLIPPGTRQRPPPGDGEVSARSATIPRPFYLAACEVTREQWHRVMNPDGAAPDDPDAQLPVGAVSYAECLEFCRRLNQLEGVLANTYRLPTEMEWEYACQAGVRSRYLSGDDEVALRTAGWYQGNSDGKPHPVAGLLANPWGLHDTHGNLAEWCLDWKAPLPVGDLADYRGPETGDQRVLKGGSYLQPAASATAEWRIGAAPDVKRPDIGFRILRILPDPSE